MKAGPKSPRIPAFKHSTRNKSVAAYVDRARVLSKKFGVTFGFPLNERLTPQRKAAVTRKLRQVSGYLNPRHRFRFVAASPTALRAVKKRGDIAPQAVTKKGVFLQAPKSKKKARYKIKPTGEIELRLGSRVNNYALYKSVDIVRDPGLIEREATRRKASHVLVNIKGYGGKTTYTVASFMFYLKEHLIPDIEEAWEDPEKDTAFRKYFGVEFVKFTRRKKPDENRQTKKANRRK